MLDEPTPNALPPLEPALQDAERLLRESLIEVCSTDPTAADTGEMIRLDETLAIAGEAAKRAVSLRRRMRQEGRATPRTAKTGTRRRGTTMEGPTTPGAPRSSRAGKAAPADMTSVEGAGTPASYVPASAPSEEGPKPARPDDSAQAAPAHDTPSGGTSTEFATLADAASEHRTFRDTHGVTWSVWAVHPQHATRRAGLRGTFVQGWLAFVCEAEKRRLSPVPDGWMQVDDAELERLCGSAEVAKPEAVTRRMPPIRGD